MADILPSRPEIPDDEDKDPRVVGLDSDDVDDLLAAISSDTARRLLAEIHEDPGAPSELADRVDTSIQNAQYHLDRLETAGLIEAAGTAYSEKGREMTVFAPSDQALVVVAGSEDDTVGLQSALTQLLGGLGVVALGSVVVDRLVRAGAAPALSTGGSGAGGAGGSGGSAAPTPADAGAGGANLSATATTATPAPETATTTEGGVRIAEATRTAADSATPTSTPTPTAAPTSTPTPASTETVAEATRTATEAARTAAATTHAAAGGSGVDPLSVVGSAVASLPPGAFFFLGGVVALAFVALVWQR